MLAINWRPPSRKRFHNQGMILQLYSFAYPSFSQSHVGRGAVITRCAMWINTDLMAYVLIITVTWKVWNKLAGGSGEKPESDSTKEEPAIGLKKQMHLIDSTNTFQQCIYKQHNGKNGDYKVELLVCFCSLLLGKIREVYQIILAWNIVDGNGCLESWCSKYSLWTS